MEHIFVQVLETGLATGGIILLVLMLSFVLKKAPKMVSYVLWIMVFVRLACPVEFASPVGLMPSVQISSDGVIVEGFGKNSRIAFPWSEEKSMDRQPDAVSGEEDVSDREEFGASGTDGSGEKAGAPGMGEAASKASEELVSDHQDTLTEGGGVRDGEGAQETLTDGRHTDLEEMSREEKEAGEAFPPGGFTKEKAEMLLRVLAVLWGIGAAGMGLYGIYQAFKLKRFLAEAKRWAGPGSRDSENRLYPNAEPMAADRIFLSDVIAVPFVFGLFRPSIYLPSDLPEESRDYVLLHEQTHIRHRDYLVKYAAYVLLCLYWFQPLVWLAYWMLEKNMEFACDESVIARLDGEKKEYSSALLGMAAGYGYGKGKQRLPIAFSEKNTTSRIRNIVRYKRPGKVVAAVLAILVVAAVFCLMTNRGTDQGEPGSAAGVEAETEEDGFPCIVVDKDKNMIATKRFGQVQAIVMDWARFPSYDPAHEEKYSILENTFAGCGQLERITVQYGDEIEYVAENAFDGCADNLVVYCNKDTYLRKRLQEIGVKWQDLTVVDEALEASLDENGQMTEAGSPILDTTPYLIMTESGEALAASSDFPNQTSDFTFPSETKKIGDALFCNFAGIESVTIPADVTEIGELAFGASLIEEVVFEGNQLKKIGAGAFMGMPLKHLELPEGLEEIGKEAFQIYIPDGPKELTLPSSLKKLEESAVSISSLEKLTVLSRDVEYQGDMILASLEEDAEVFCYKGSTTEAYLQSHGYDVKIKYLEDTAVPEETGQGVRGSDALYGTAVDAERKKAVDAVTSRVDGHSEGDMTFSDNPWEIHWWADVTGDGLPNEIVVSAVSRKKYRVSVLDCSSALRGQSSGGRNAKRMGEKRIIWRWEKKLETFGRKLGLYYQDGKTYLMEWNLEMNKKKTSISYEVFQLDKTGERVTLDGESMEYPPTQWKKYREKDQALVQRGHKYMRASDLILGESNLGVLCSVPLQKINMYGFED